MSSITKFVVAYALYTSVVLGYTYHLLTHPAGALFSLSHTALAALTAVALALPILDAMGWRLLRPGRIGKALAAVLFVGVLAEAAARGDLGVAGLLGTAIRLLLYLIVLMIAIAIYQMARPRESTPGRSDDATKRYTF